jgi:predicted RNase H-like HicB family nuclease
MARSPSRPATKRRAAKPKRVFNLPVVVELDEDGVFIVSVPTLVGCRSYGVTLDEAMKNIEEAAALCIESGAPLGESRSKFVGVRHLRIAG